MKARFSISVLRTGHRRPGRGTRANAFRRFSLGLGLSFLGSVWALAAPVHEDFNGYAPGPLDGQGGWIAGGAEGLVQVAAGFGVNRSNVLTNADTEMTGYAAKEVTPGWGEARVATLSIDFSRHDGMGVAAWAGFQSSGTARGYGVFIRTADIGFREGASGGEHVIHTDAEGVSISIENGTWYRITYAVALDTNTITKATLENLTAGGVIPLYFGPNRPTFTPGSAAAPARWNQMRVRLPGSDRGRVMLDRLNLIPGPGAAGSSASAAGPVSARPMARTREEAIMGGTPATYAWSEGVYPFEPDPYTLLLAHFDKDIRQADYAMGYTRFGGMGWTSREGAYGAGIDLDRTAFLHEDFYNQSDSALPFFYNFGISPHGNFDPFQGTLEFWFLLKDEQEGVLFHSDNGRHGVMCRLSPQRLVVSWPGLGTEDIRGSVRFDRPLQPGRWHYYTQTWSAGEFAIYIDGRLVFTHDMTETVGLVSSRVDKAGIYIGGTSSGSPLEGGLRMGLDELALSSVVRYVGDFEPPWPEGRRPEHAYPGSAARPRRFERVEAAPALAASMPSAFRGEPLAVTLAGGLSAHLDSADGWIKSVSDGTREIVGETGGILIWEGLDRDPLPARADASAVQSEPDALSFRQQYGEDLLASTRITTEAAGTVWEVTLRNTAAEARWLEVQLSLPLPLPNITEVFDGSSFHQDLRLPRRKTEFAKTLPFTAAGNAERYAGIGLHAGIWVSDLVNEWIPLDGGGVIRQGFKAVLDPNGETTYRFFVFSGDSAYGARKAVERYYHAHEEPFFVKNDAVSVLTHMPCAYVMTQPQRKELPYGLDVARRLYGGHGWRFEVHYGIKGDEAGIGPYFHNEEYRERPEYEFANRRWNQNRDLDHFRERQRREAQTSFLNNYTQHVRHWHPQTLNMLIIEDHYPEALLDRVGDKQQCGAKYAEGLIRALMVNTYNTPLYDWNRRQVDFFAQAWGEWNKGFCHDTTYDCTARAIDPLARQTVGRSFSRDRGEFLRKAFGFAQHFQYLGTHRVGQHALAALGDGSYMSYMTAVTADKHLTEEMRFNDSLGYPGRFSTGRIMAGEKAFDAPIGRLFSMDRSHTWLGDRFLELSEPELRQYYRYFLDQYLLHCFQNGVYMSALLSHGKQRQFERRALLVEAVMAGHRVVTAAEAEGELFVTRYGRDLDTIVVVGNPKPFAQTSDVVVDGGEIAGGAALVLGDYYGGSGAMTFEGPKTVLHQAEVGRRDVRAFRALGALHGAPLRSARVEYDGDGITFRTRIELETEPNATLSFKPFLPKDYRIERLAWNGNGLLPDETGAVAGHTGSGTLVLEVQYQSTVLDLPPAVWREAELLATDEARVQAVVPETATEYDKGTLAWIHHFVLAYDYEDNIKGNLARRAFATEGDEFEGWQLTLDTTGQAQAAGVSIDGRRIVVRGHDDFERRRAMAVFMRLLDRKYPAVGAFLFPSDLNSYESLESMLDRPVAELIESYAFHKKPLLDEAHEHLYEGGNLDFQGAYSLKTAPYIYEPGDWR